MSNIWHFWVPMLVKQFEVIILKGRHGHHWSWCMVLTWVLRLSNRMWCENKNQSASGFQLNCWYCHVGHLKTYQAERLCHWWYFILNIILDSVCELLSLTGLTALISGRYRVRNQGLHGCVHWDSQALQSGWLPDSCLHLWEALQHHLSRKQWYFPGAWGICISLSAVKPLGDPL